jgi:hypothetical protein
VQLETFPLPECEEIQMNGMAEKNNDSSQYHLTESEGVLITFKWL